MAEPIRDQQGRSSEEERIYERLEQAFEQERRRMAKLMASKDDGHLFGETEFQLRDMALRLGAKALETAADERQKKGRIRRC